MAAILNSANLNSAILDSTILSQKTHLFILTQLDDQPSSIWPSWIQILVFPLKLTHTCQDWFTPFPKKKKTSLPLPLDLYHLHKILHSFILINLMMAAILNSAILDSAILNKTLTQTNSIWLKLLHSHSTWWRQPSWIQPFCTKKKLLSFILTQLDDGSHLEFCQLEFHHLGFSHLSISSQTNSHLPRLVPTICTKNLHSFILTQLDDGSHLEFCHVEFRHMASWIQTPCYLFSDSLQNTLTPLWLWIKLIQSDSNSFLLM